jgi:hypothetical protein
VVAGRVPRGSRWCGYEGCFIRKLVEKKFSETNPRGVKLGVLDHEESICEVRSGEDGVGMAELEDTDGSYMM